MALLPCAKHLCHAPRLGYSAARREGRLAFGNFTHRSQAVSKQVMRHWLDEGEGELRVVIDPQMREYKRPQQPRPNRPLVICSVAFGLRPTVVSLVMRVRPVQGAKPLWSQQAAHADVDHSCALLKAERTFGQRHRENL